MKSFFKSFLLWVFLLPIFILTSVPEKYNVSLRTLIASIIYISQLTSFFLLYTFYGVRLKLNRKINLKLIFLFFGAVFWITIFTTTGTTYLLKIFLNILIGYFCYRIFISSRTDSLKILKSILILNVTALFIETICFNLFQSDLQIHNSLFPFSRQNIFEVESGFFRASGLQYEPGNHSILTTILILLINFLDKKSDNKRLIIFSIISIFLTRSLVGVALGIILILFFFFKKSYFSLKGVITISLFSLIFFGTVLSYVVYRTENTDTFRSLNQKRYLVELLLQKDFYSLAVGNGIENNENIENNRNLGFVKDLGAVFNLIYTYGAYGALIVFTIFKNLKLNSFYKKVLMALIITMSKFATLFPVFFVLIFCSNLPMRSNLNYAKHTQSSI